MSKKINEMITSRMIEKMEHSDGSLSSLWSTSGASWPMNFVSKKPYRGINVFMLWMMNYSSPYWVSYKQAKDLGGRVRAGEKSTPIVFWKLIPHPTDPKGFIPFMRYYAGFNTDQCDGLEGKVPQAGEQNDRDVNPIQSCRDIVAGYDGMPIVLNDRACSYSPSRNTIQMAKPHRFVSDEAYYSVLFHEMTHSTGHKDKLARKSITEAIRHGSPTYAKEELTAELGAAFLCAQAGILHKTEGNSADYPQYWITQMKADSSLIIKAAQQAQKAFDRIVPEECEAKEIIKQVA